jgi:dihydrofolate reductase|tara:strand:- start:11106 stop:11627 length:522 start_codon:yes stop_codon:yes gene_type:complete
MIKAIFAAGLNGEIGQNGDMPWGRGLPKDLEYFKKVTEGNTVIMGNNTFKSLPFKNGLPNRDNGVLSSEVPELSKAGFIKKGERLFFLNKQYTCAILELNFSPKDYYLIGGASIYEQFWDYVEQVHITTVNKAYPEADTYFTPDLSNFEKVGEPVDVSSEDLEASVQVWRRKQ